MRFMVIMKATADSEAGVKPATEDFATMGAFIQELVDDGVLLAADGLAPSSMDSARIYFDGDTRTVVDGPFTETKELIAGYWLVEMKSVEEAVERFKRAPIQQPRDGAGTNLEIRRAFGPEDFGDEFTEEQRAAAAEREAQGAANR